MAGKPELSAAAPGLQNVVVYVSNDNFAQAYTVNDGSIQHHHDAAGYPNTVASLVATAATAAPAVAKSSNNTTYQHHNNHPEQKQQQQLIEAAAAAANSYASHHHQPGYFTNQAVISQNGFPQPVVNYKTTTDGGVGQHHHLNHHLKPGFGDVVYGGGGKECTSVDFADGGSYVVMGGEGTTVRCDSVRSETAESSCSSLSSADDGMLVVPQQSEQMVVYDSGGVNVRQGVVVAVGAAPHSSNSSVTSESLPTNNDYVIVPHGWKRLATNGGIIYISPSNTALSSLDQIKDYLLTAGTCKCGLECPLKFDSSFNFDPKVMGKPWTLSPDSNSGDLTKLCNHKRKMIAMASLGCKPPDSNKLPKDYIKKKKRKLCGPYAGVSVSILAQRDTLASQQFTKENLSNSQQFTTPPPQQQQQQPDQQQMPQQPQQQQQQQQQQMWPGQQSGGIFQSSQPFYRYQSPTEMPRMSSPMVVGDSVIMQSASNQNISHQMQLQQAQQQSHPPPNALTPQQQQGQPPQPLPQMQQIIGPNGQLINMLPNQNLVSQNQQSQPQQRVFVNGQPNEATGPGRPALQMVPVSIPTNRPELRGYYNPNAAAAYQGVVQQFDPTKNNVRAFHPNNNGYRHTSSTLQNIINQQQQQPPPQQQQQQQQQKIWSQRIAVPLESPQQQQQQQQQQQHVNVYDRVPPLHQHQPQPQPQPTIWNDEINKKKYKVSKGIKKRTFAVMDSPHRSMDSPCPNIDVRQIPSENRQILVNQYDSDQAQTSSPSFLEDPSGYLAQQTALLNNTINRQTGANGCTNYICNSPVASSTSNQIISSQPNGVPLPSNIQMKQQAQQPQPYQQAASIKSQENVMKNAAMSMHQYNQLIINQQQGLPDSSAMNDINCQGCIVEYQQSVVNKDVKESSSRPNSQPSTPSSSGTGEDPVTSSTYSDKHPSPDSRPIQGGTVSTSNVSPVESSPEPATPPQIELQQINYNFQPSEQNQNANQFSMQQAINQNSANQIVSKQEIYCQQQQQQQQPLTMNRGVVTTMASGRTVGSNTITSVLAGRANTATVSITNPATAQQSIPSNSTTSKSPLEMVQSVVSSIKVPHTQAAANVQQINVQNIPQQIVKPSLPPGHLFVSSGGQLIMASTNSGQVMPPPPPPKIVTNQTSMPPISVSPMITNVTASVTQMIPAVAQQVLGQQTVLVNALPAPFVLQPGVTMTMDGMNMQIPQLVTGNVIQQQIQIDNSDPRRVSSLLSPENKKKGKKRKVSQTVASMLHIASQQNSGVVGFPQQIQMAHSPQGLTTTPVMQALTIVPGKAGAPPQIVMNGQLPNTQSILNSPSQQINLLQPVNLAQGMVQNFPTIQQFVLPNLAGMVMNADGTATIVQDTNIGMQLQLQNVNGQNVLTPVQNNQVFTGGQSIIPTGMVIRPQGKIIQQQHSPGAQFLSPTGGGQFVAQFNGQLSPLVANVSPGQQVTFSTTPQPTTIRAQNVQPPQQEFIQCGQTLMVPANIAVSTSNQQNTTFVQQNTTIVQQQTTMLANNQNQQNQTLNMDQNFMISESKQPIQTVLLQQRQQSPLQQQQQQQPQPQPQPPQQQQQQQQQQHLPPNYRHSISTQTPVNGQPVTTNTFCQTSTTSAGSPPDTTTHSPLASGGQSPPTADTTTHSGSTDDGLSPAPSNCSGSCNDVITIQRQQQSSMAMVHCISSSEPDSAETTLQPTDFDWRSVSITPKMEYTDITSAGHMNIKKSTPTTHFAIAESSTMMQFVSDTMKQQEAIVSSRNYEKQKRKHSDTLVVMETRHMHSSLFDDDDDENDEIAKRPHTFVSGDLVWGPAKGCPAWPGKLIQLKQNTVMIRWFGGDKSLSEVDPSVLQTLTEGLEAHHRAGKKSRTGRKLNSQLEKAIQEAMAELDKLSEQEGKKKATVAAAAVNSNDNNVVMKKSTGRLRSSQR